MAIEEKVVPSTGQGEAEAGPAEWERWTKKRVFVRALEGTYGQLKAKVINPQAVKVAQSIECHIDVYAPGGYGQKHGHMNSAVFYVLKGKGHDVHDTKRHEWEAGDALIVENGCVHQHFSDDKDGECIVLIMKAKPLFLFMHMIFQKVVSYPPTEPSVGHENYAPPPEL